MRPANLTQDPPGNPVRHSYTYDAENRLTGIPGQGIAYTYDAEGKRVGEYTAGTLSKSFLRDQGQSSFAIFDNAGNLSSVDLFAAGRHIFHDGGGYWGYAITDALGSTKEMISDPQAWVITICSNLAFGDGQSCENVDGQPFHFTGKERDTESGLDYFGARYYSSTMGQWMSPDWSGSPEAVPYSTLSDPQSLNLYGYVRNNPATTVDADGHLFNTPGEPGGAPAAFTFRVNVDLLLFPHFGFEQFKPSYLFWKRVFEPHTARGTEYYRGQPLPPVSLDMVVPFGPLGAAELGGAGVAETTAEVLAKPAQRWAMKACTLQVER